VEQAKFITVGCLSMMGNMALKPTSAIASLEVSVPGGLVLAVMSS
jgi:hypothetical protein